MYGFDIAGIASVNRRLAYYLATCDHVVRPHIYTIRAQFTTAEPDKPVSGTLDFGGPCDDFWVTDLVYQIRRPMAYPCNILKAQSDVNNAINPGIDMSLSIDGGSCGDLMITVKKIPIELVARPASLPADDGCCDWLQGFVIHYCETVTAEFVLRRTLCPEELPTEVILAFKGYRLGCTNWNNLTISQATCGLQDLGFLGGTKK